MTYGELREKLNTFNEHQLSTTVMVFENDDEQGTEVDFLEEQEDDFYWMDGECYGTLLETEVFISENPEMQFTLNDFKITPKGTPTLHITDNV